MESAPGIAALPPGTDLGRPLSDDDVAAIALWNNAAFQEVLAELGLARADVILAGQLTNPSFFMLFPAGPKQLEFYAKLPLEALWLRSTSGERMRAPWQAKAPSGAESL